MTQDKRKEKSGITIPPKQKQRTTTQINANMTISEYRAIVKKNKYHVILLPLPGEKAALYDLLLSCASLSPENITILDDNFDHHHLFSLREVFRNFSCPAVRLNRNGAGVPLNTPNTISLDIDHYRNGFLAAQEVLKKNCAVKIPAPLLAPKMHRLKTNSRLFTVETPLIGAVPI